MPSVSVKDVDPHKFVKALAEFLKKTGKMKVPEWTDIVKTAKYKELAPFDEDWFYIRAASMARHMYMRATVGIGAVRKIYGGSKSNGVAPSHFCRSSGAVARKGMQALALLKLCERDQNTGWRLTSQGRRDLDRIAAQVQKKKPKRGSESTN